MNSKYTKCIQYFIKVSVPLGRVHNSNLYLPKKYYTRNYFTSPLKNYNNYNFNYRNTNDSFRYNTNKFFYQKDSIIIKNWFRIDNSCRILSIIPFHFSFLPILLNDSNIDTSNELKKVKKVNEVQIINHTESSPNLIEKCFNYIYNFISDYIIEPILISYRFTYLLCIFLPLIIGSPLILIGKKVPEYNNERTGTLWWYNKLMRIMEMAGPTFIKVCDGP
jgi:hypothetical protein